MKRSFGDVWTSRYGTGVIPLNATGFEAYDSQEVSFQMNFSPSLSISTWRLQDLQPFLQENVPPLREKLPFSLPAASPTIPEGSKGDDSSFVMDSNRMTFQRASQCAESKSQSQVAEQRGHATLCDDDPPPGIATSTRTRHGAPPTMMGDIWSGVMWQDDTGLGAPEACLELCLLINDQSKNCNQVSTRSI